MNFFRIYLKDKIKSTFGKRNREPIFLEMMKRAVSSNMSIIEIGSSDGNEAAYILEETQGNVDVLIVEPDLRNLDRAKTNVRRVGGENAPVTFINAAVGSVNGMGNIYINREKPNLNSSIAGDKDGYSTLKVKYIRIEQLIRKYDLRKPILIKMDIEGYEVSILNSISDLLLARSDISILMEVHPEKYNESNSLEIILRRLNTYGYEIDLLESAGSPIPREFHKHGLQPCLIEGTRGLYKNVPFDLALEFASRTHSETMILPPRRTNKIVRSILVRRTQDHQSVADSEMAN